MGSSQIAACGSSGKRTQTSDYGGDDDFRILARTWHCNLVRISVHPSSWRDRRAEAMVALERDVTAALANRMWVIIDWHAIGWPDGYSPGPLYDTDWGLARSFWQ